MPANFARASSSTEFQRNGPPHQLRYESVGDAIRALRAIDEYILKVRQPEKHCDPQARTEIERLVAERAETLRNLVSIPQILAEDVAPFLDVLIESLQLGGHIACERRCEEDVFYTGLDRVRVAIDQLCSASSSISELRLSIAKYTKMQQFYSSPDRYCPDLIIHQIAIPQAEACDERRGTSLVGVSDGWCRLLGFRPDEVLGTKIDYILTDESRDRAFNLFPRYLETGCYHDEPFDFVSKSGKVISIVASGIAQRNSAGEIVADIGIYTPCD